MILNNQNGKGEQKKGDRGKNKKIKEKWGGMAWARWTKARRDQTSQIFDVGTHRVKQGFYERISSLRTLSQFPVRNQISSKTRSNF